LEARGGLSCRTSQTKLQKMELRVLGLLGKTLSGLWMKRFYMSAETEINFVEGIRVVEKVLANIKVAANSPERLLTKSVDLFGDPLVVDATMSALLNGVAREDANFSVMMKCCLMGITDVIDRQYAKYSSWDLDLKLEQETKSARSHNIDAEEVMGMFSAARSVPLTQHFVICRAGCGPQKTGRSRSWTP